MDAAVILAVLADTPTLQYQKRATRAETEKARIDGYWNSLPPADQETLRAEALAKTNSFILGLYRRSRKGSPEAERYLKIILQAYITALLDQRDASQAPA